MTTPVRSMLLQGSGLQSWVCDGLPALQRAHGDCLEAGLRSSFADSLALDEAVKKGHEEENRWDYLLGHRDSGHVIGLEPHSAKNQEVSTVIAKRKRAIEQLRDHVRDGKRVAAWYWVASGDVEFSPFEKKKLLLDQNGITFVGKKLLRKHLPAVTPQSRS